MCGRERGRSLPARWLPALSMRACLEGGGRRLWLDMERSPEKERVVEAWLLRGRPRSSMSSSRLCRRGVPGRPSDCRNMSGRKGRGLCCLSNRRGSWNRVAGWWSLLSLSLSLSCFLRSFSFPVFFYYSFFSSVIPLQGQSQRATRLSENRQHAEETSRRCRDSRSDEGMTAICRTSTQKRKKGATT